MDKRVERSKAVVLDETYRLLTEGGIGGVSVDEISRRSGVSKTTIYRHWPSRSALLLDACSKIGTQAHLPDTGALKTDLYALAHYLASELRSARWPAILPSIIDAAERDTDVAEMHGTLNSKFMAPFIAVAERAKGRGELGSSEASADLVARVVGPIFYRRWFSKEGIDDAFLTCTVDHAVARVSAPTSPD
jgi:AcrR family transcriptional regulator